MLAEHIEMIGAQVQITCEQQKDRAGSLGVDVIIVDVRSVYGRVQYLVRPVTGAGSKWIDAERVTLKPT